ncbi:MAG: UDP-N-acetylmuramoyl-L-alanine--D-glutamate ligase [Actinobacteria bacterium]|nr:UDP-N-acetylmuramoyl-L-alanine--D-glutamate ligase [Actinomycetota bacterium]MCL6105320.1 UDP-N-acetylmuramoyl-L-alanine--D-glutamate ligase [Actinomycetota bacterium]
MSLNKIKLTRESFTLGLNRLKVQSLHRVMVIGMAVSGQAVSNFLIDNDVDVVAVDDCSSDNSLPTKLRTFCSELGIEMVETPDFRLLKKLLDDVDLVVLSPGVPPTHPVFSLRSQLHIVSELELAWAFCDVPIVAVTGTNGKTTVCTLLTEILCSSGINAQAVGNIGIPLISAVHHSAPLSTGKSADVFVVEASSFQLAFTFSFHPKVAIWLNVSPNHLDWHPSMEDYIRSKSKIWANLDSDDTAIAGYDDPVVMQKVMEAKEATGVNVVTFGLRDGDWCIKDGWVISDTGEKVLLQSELYANSLTTSLNSLAGCAGAYSIVRALNTGDAGGASVIRRDMVGIRKSCAQVLKSFKGLPHRMEFVKEHMGVGYFNDSKATTPVAVLSALAQFPPKSVILIAGGRSKGLDLSVLRKESGKLKAVVGIGEASVQIQRVFDGCCHIEQAHNMLQAVELASSLASSSDVVLLSPGCSSFDWYSSYIARGEEFKRCVYSIIGGDR